MNPRQMKQAMRKMGISQEDVEALEVVIRTPDKEIYFKNPQVAKIRMMGQDSWQITGEAVEREVDARVEINEEDVKTVASQANVDEEEARKAIEEANGDLAEAILKLTNKE